MLTDFGDDLLNPWTQWDWKALEVNDIPPLPDLDDQRLAGTVYAANLRNNFVRTVFGMLMTKWESHGTHA